MICSLLFVVDLWLEMQWLWFVWWAY